MNLSMIPRQRITALLLLLLLLGTVSAKKRKNEQESSTSSSKVSCDMYMAESTIPHAGLGIFTTIPREEGDIVGNGDVCLPILEMGWHQGQNFFNPFADYVWAGEVMGMKEEVRTLDIEAMCPGLDCAINCNLALINVGKATPIYHDGGLHRASDPGAGALTPYHNGTTYVSRAIPAGGELFKFYGDNWFTTRNNIFASLPLSGDFPKAQRLLERYSDVSDRSEPLYELLVELRTLWNSRTLNAIPATYEEVLVALEHDIGMTHQPNATRSIEWLEEHGKCVDHIIPKQSTIRQAGHGAYAKRDLPQGTLITGSPLHHLPFGQSAMDIFDFHQNAEGHWVRGPKIGKQVLLNYCFGHRDSTLLLCPYGAGVNYINHNQSRANVKIQWAADGTSSHQASWLERKPDDMKSDLAARLGIDYIATKDIKEGEELFLDYGDDFEKSWQEHIQNWKPEQWEGYLNGHQWNTLFEDFPLRTQTEAKHDPYPTTLQIRCHTEIVNTKVGHHQKKEYKWELSEYGFPCRILEREYDATVHEDVYTVEITTEPKDRWDPYEGSRISTNRGIPRKAIRFLDLPNTSDLHLRNAFRKEIGIPDDIFPEAWKNSPATTRSSGGVMPDINPDTPGPTSYQSYEPGAELKKPS